MEFSDFVAKAGLLPDHLKNKPADCLLVAMQAQNWKMNFFAVAQCTSLVRGKMMYEGKLVAAVVNASGLLKGALNHRFIGDEQPNLSCVITGTLKEEGTPRTWEVPWNEAFKHAQDKGQWLASPKKRLLYFATREWARVHMPEVMLGVQADDEQLPNPKDEIKVEATRTIEQPARKVVEATTTAVAADAEEVGPPEHWSELYATKQWRSWMLPDHSRFAGMTVNDAIRDGKFLDIVREIDESEPVRLAIDAGRFAALEHGMSTSGISANDFLAELIQVGILKQGDTFFDATPRQLSLMADTLRAVRARKADEAAAASAK